METTNTNPPKKSKFKKFLLYTFVIFILVSVAYVFICGMAYSEGTRGYVQSF